MCTLHKMFRIMYRYLKIEQHLLTSISLANSDNFWLTLPSQWRTTFSVCKITFLKESQTKSQNQKICNLGWGRKLKFACRSKRAHGIYYTLQIFTLLHWVMLYIIKENCIKDVKAEVVMTATFVFIEDMQNLKTHYYEMNFNVCCTYFSQYSFTCFHNEFHQIGHLCFFFGYILMQQ